MTHSTARSLGLALVAAILTACAGAADRPSPKPEATMQAVLLPRTMPSMMPRTLSSTVSSPMLGTIPALTPRPETARQGLITTSMRSLNTGGTLGVNPPSPRPIPDVAPSIVPGAPQPVPEAQPSVIPGAPQPVSEFICVTPVNFCRGTADFDVQPGRACACGSDVGRTS